MVLKDLQRAVFCCYTSSLYAAGEPSNLVAGNHVTCIIIVAVYGYVRQVLPSTPFGHFLARIPGMRT